MQGSRNAPSTKAPLDRSIRVRAHGSDIWLRVRWNPTRGWFDVEDGDGSWIEADEIESWREMSHPSIGIGTPRE